MGLVEACTYALDREMDYFAAQVFADITIHLDFSDLMNCSGNSPNQPFQKVDLVSRILYYCSLNIDPIRREQDRKHLPSASSATGPGIRAPLKLLRHATYPSCLLSDGRCVLHPNTIPGTEHIAANSREATSFSIVADAGWCDLDSPAIMP